MGRSFHPTKGKGDFTHYGDQMLLLLEDIAAARGFTLDHFAGAWQSFFSTYDGYFDHATKDTLENFKNGASPHDSGSQSTELAGAARISPLLYFYRGNEGGWLPAVRAQTLMTHNQEDVVKSAIFFSDVTRRVLAGQTPSAAVLEAAQTCQGQRNIISWVNLGKESRDRDTRQAIAGFGQQCATAAAFPGVIHLVLKYENDLKTALVENVMAGGDSAARGMLAGMILGAHGGHSAIPGHWLSEMRAYPRITELLDNIDEMTGSA
jgi:ADP-ribosylglycohydrolase